MFNRSDDNRPRPDGVIPIPPAKNWDRFEANREKADSENLDHCPVCGKAITNPKFFFNSIYGGNAYPAADKNEYADAWVMGVGPECKKRFPEGYIFEIDEQ